MHLQPLLLNPPMLLLRRGMARAVKAEAIINLLLARERQSPDWRGGEIGVPGIQPIQFLPRARRYLSGDQSQSPAIPSICSRYDPLVLIPLTPSYYCPSRTPPPYCLPWLGTQQS